MGRLFELMTAASEAAIREDWDDLVSYYTDDVTAWSPSYELDGRAAMVEAIQAQNGPFDDVRQVLTLVAEVGDTVVVEWTWSVPHPSGVGRVSQDGLTYAIFDGDQIATIRQFWDNAGIMQQFEAETGIEE